MLVTKRVMYEKRPSYDWRDERTELVADERRRQVEEPGLKIAAAALSPLALKFH